MEIRRFHRLLLEIEVNHSKEAVEVSREHSLSKNISEGGICITTYEKPMKLHDLYKLDFMLPGQFKSIIAEGRVVWNKEYSDSGETFFDNGIEFVDLKPEYKEMLEEFSIGTVSGE